MWAQLIQMRLKPGKDTAAMIEEIQAAEQPGSGLVRSLLMHDQSDPSRVYTLVLFESEETARAREQDPLRQDRLDAARKIMADIFDGPPEFTDLVVDEEWADTAEMSRRKGRTMDHSETTRRTYELISAGDIDGFGELVSEDFVEHEAIPGLAPTKEGVLELFRGYRAAFPDLRLEALDILATGDKTVARVKASGTQNGEFMGMPPSGRLVEVPMIDIMRFDEAGLVCEHWGVMDMLSMLQQLGAIPDSLPA